MKGENNNFLYVRKSENKTVALFREMNQLTVPDSEAIRLKLIDIVTKRNSELEINLLGIKFIDSSIIDVFNLLYRMAKRFNSKVIITHVNEELMELIELVKIHAVFDIRTVLLHEPQRVVA